MKAKFIRGTTLRGRVLNEGEVHDLDEADFRLFVRMTKDAVAYTEPQESKPAAVEATEAPADGKKGKK